MLARIACIALVVSSFTGWAGTTLEQRSADLEFARVQLPRLHPDFFSLTSPSVFESAAGALAADMETLSDEQFYSRLSALIALARDGHTAINLDKASLGFVPLPISLRWFDDGIFVAMAQAEYVDLNGARLLSINDVTIEDVAQLIRPLVSYENEWWFQSRAPSYMINLGVLRAIGVVPQDAPARIKFRLAKGGERTVELGARTAGLIRPVQQTPGFTQYTLRGLDQNYFAEYWPSTKTLYVAYRVCQEMPAKPIHQFAAEVIDLLANNDIGTVVIDLRGNGGGSSLYFQLLLNDVASSLVPLFFNPEFRAYGLIDRGVYSSGLMAAEDLKTPTDIPQVIVRLAGEPTGGKPTHYGSVLPFALPATGLSGNHSTRLFHAPEHIPDLAALMPDLPVPLRSTDYFVRHDPYLAAVFARARYIAVPDGPRLIARDPEDVTQPGMIDNQDGAANDAGHAAPHGAVIELTVRGVNGDADVRAWIGQERAQVLDATPSRVRVRVPERAASGPNPIVVAMDEFLSNAVTVWVE